MGSDEYRYWKSIEDIGNSDALASERTWLSTQAKTELTTTKLGVNETTRLLFDYDWMDTSADWSNWMNNKFQLTTRAGGGMQLVGGAGVVVVGGGGSCGATPGAACVAGIPLMYVGGDQAYAGASTLVWGVPTQTAGGNLLTQAGLSSAVAEAVYDLLGGAGAARASKSALSFLRPEPATVAIDLKNLTWRKLLEEANSFPSRQSASEVATMIGAYDPVSGAYAVGRSSPTITADMLDPRTVAFVEGRLGVPIGSKTTLCSNIAGACAEVMAADELIRKGADLPRWNLPRRCGQKMFGRKVKLQINQ